MKLRSAPLDDIFQELQSTLDQDSGRLARLMRRFFVGAYRSLKSAMLLALGLKWHTRQRLYPPIGHEPFNIPPEEMAREWGRL